MATSTKDHALVLLRGGQTAAAKALLEESVASDGSDAEAWYLLGNIHGSSGSHERALQCFEKASQLRPEVADVARNLGATLQILGRIDEAVECYRRFLRRAPGTAEIHYNLGNALAELGARAEAIASYRAALALKPGWLDAHLNLGDTLDEADDLDGAAAQYESAVAAEPSSAAALHYVASALADQGRAEEAVAAYARATSLQSDGAMGIQAATVLPVVPASLEEMQRWRARFESEVDRLSRLPLVLKDPVRQVPRPNFYLSYHGLPNRDLHRKIAALYLHGCPSLQWTAGEKPRSERIRVGFISRYLYSHSIGKTTRGLIANLSRQRFEAVALFVPPVRDDSVSRFIRANSDRSVVLPPTLEGARQVIADLSLDVLFYQDIGMEPFTYFLAFSRLAPVQCVSFGHPDTTGIPAMDYFVSNDLYESADAAQHYSERLFQLRDLGTLAYYYRPEKPAAMKRREDFGFPEGTRLHVCPQALFKLHPAFDATLGAILRADPAARLVLIEGKSRHWGRVLRERFARAFPDVADRVIFLAPQSGADFTRLVAACDVMLDTPHFNGMNTSLEAFALGTPVVTMPTALQRGRHTAGMYRKMEFGECIAANSEEYVRIVLRLSRDAEYRRHASEQILARSGVLFEDLRVVREFERFFVEAREAVR